MAGNVIFWLGNGFPPSSPPQQSMPAGLLLPIGHRSPTQIVFLLAHFFAMLFLLCLASSVHVPIGQP
jgi:hypothetical protein